MVHSNGTRLDSQRFKMDLTDKRKYSGFSRDLRLVSQPGEFAARRAMPTSGAGGVWSCGGGQSADGRSGLPIRQPASPRARGASGLGFGSSGQNGRKAAGRRTGRRRVVRRADESGRTGDIAHLERRKYFAFSSLCQALSLFVRLHNSYTLAHSFCLLFYPLG